MTIDDLIAAAETELERRRRVDRRAARVARAAAKGSAEYLDAEEAWDDATQAVRAAERELERLRASKAEDDEIYRKQCLVVAEIRYRADGSSYWAETREGYQERRRTGAPCNPRYVAYDDAGPNLETHHESRNTPSTA
jgi:hypothetical protein